ncbi:unnamed protein product, partial [Strongylus vulgaris]
TKSNPSQRILWSGVLLLVAVIFTLFTYQVLRDYFGFQTTTKLIVKQVGTMVGQNSTMLLPSLHVCPKNPDHLNYDVLFSDIDQRLENLTREMKQHMVLYFIAGNGFMNTEIYKWDIDYRNSVGRLVDLWMGPRTMMEMFRFVFDENGIQCEDVSWKSFWSFERVSHDYDYDLRL